MCALRRKRYGLTLLLIVGVYTVGGIVWGAGQRVWLALGPQAVFVPLPYVVPLSYVVPPPSAVPPTLEVLRLMFVYFVLSPGSWEECLLLL